MMEKSPRTYEAASSAEFSPWMLDLSGEAHKGVWWKIHLLQSNSRICVLFGKTSRLFMFLYLIPSGRAPIWEALLPLEAWGGIALKGDTSTRAAHTGIKVRVRYINSSKPGLPNKACQSLEVFGH